MRAPTNVVELTTLGVNTYNWFDLFGKNPPFAVELTTSNPSGTSYSLFALQDVTGWTWEINPGAVYQFSIPPGANTFNGSAGLVISLTS